MNDNFTQNELRMIQLIHREVYFTFWHVSRCLLSLLGRLAPSLFRGISVLRNIVTSAVAFC